MKKTVIIFGLLAAVCLTACSPAKTTTSEDIVSQIDEGVNSTQALVKAKSYVKHGAYSRNTLSEQLTLEGFSEEDVANAVENCEADWKEEAAESAKEYLKTSSMTKEDLEDILKDDGFTDEEVSYGIANCGQEL